MGIYIRGEPEAVVTQEIGDIYRSFSSCPVMMIQSPVPPGEELDT